MVLIFRTEKSDKSHEKSCENKKKLCEIAMSSEKNNTLEFNQYLKSNNIHTLLSLTLNL